MIRACLCGTDEEPWSRSAVIILVHHYDLDYAIKDKRSGRTLRIR